jgi:pimeloyl-[acyl-carrier protein] methyl ester esterase
MIEPVRKLVLLPGMDGTGALFKNLVEALPREFETTCVGYPIRQYVNYSALQQTVRSACPAAERFVLVAESYSTPLAIRLAATNPPNLAGVVLCAGFASSPIRGLRRFACFIAAPVLGRIRLPEFAVKRWLVGPDASSSLSTDVRAAIKTVYPGVLAARILEVLTCDVRAELANIEAPILYLQSKQDRLVGASSVREILHANPDVRVVQIDGPHLLLQREPEAAAEVVAGFVRSLF